MCRWFAYISPTEDCILEDVLVTPKHSISYQVNDHYLPKLLHHDPDNITEEHEINARNMMLNVDGLGVAWYTPYLTEFSADPFDSGLRPALYKTISPPLVDFNFRSIAENTATRTLFCHIRAATSTPCTPVNNHPFKFSRHIFMHNGTVASHPKFAREMAAVMDEDAFVNIKGTTDSEYVSALYMTYLVDGKGKGGWEDTYPLEKMQDALNKTIETIIRLQKEKGITDANSLNLCTTDGEVMLAYRFRNHHVEQPPSLYFSTTAGVTLNRKYPDHPNGKEFERAGEKKSEEEHGTHLIVASEPTTYRDEDWEVIPKNNCVIVAKDGSYKVEKIQVEF